MLRVVNIKPELGGHLVIRLFEGRGFNPEEKTEPINEIRVPVQREQSSIGLGPIPEGLYFIAVYHDSNDNQKMDYAFFGRPKEGFGFSGFFDCSKRAVQPNDYTITINSYSKVVSVPLCYQ